MKLLRLSVQSFVIALVLGEISSWVLLFGYLGLSRFLDDPSGDVSSMIVTLFLDFCLRPVVSGISALLLLILFFKKSKLSIDRSLVGMAVISLTFASVVIAVVAGSVFLAAIESDIPFTGTLEIYRLFSY